jgi:23S rRNA (cytidine2498-2'-O)-methyltransferase
MVMTAYLAAEGYEEQLRDELFRAIVVVRAKHGRLFLTDTDPIVSAWAANIWYDVSEIKIDSIGNAATVLRSMQRNWAMYAPEHAGRARLIAEKLPYVSAKPVPLGAAAPSAPLGSWTLLRPDVMLAAAHCSSAFANGAVTFDEDRVGPPSRAYLKLVEAFVRLGVMPAKGDKCLDLGASPGGWTWYLNSLGAHVLAVDKAPLDPQIAQRRNVQWRGESAFGLDPASVPPVDWLCSDIVAYPERLLRLVRAWIDSGRARNIVCTLKFQGEIDHDAVAQFAAIPDAQLFHLHHNKHELTFARILAAPA